MNVRFPLTAKILFWFFLNLLLLGVVFYTFFRIQFRLGLDSLLAGQAGERIEAVSEVINAELRGTPRETWTEVLQRFSSAYGVQFFIIRPDGGHVAGDPVVLPPEVRNRLPGFQRPSGPVFPQRRWRLEPRSPEGEAPLPPPPPQEIGPRRPHPKFMVRSQDPLRYWVCVRLPIMERVAPMTLVAVSDSLSGGGLFVDYKPWVLVGFSALIVSVMFWLPLIRSITRSVAQITSATEQVAEGRFDVRVNERRRDELGWLGGAINRMAARLNGFVTGQKRFLGDVAHELCSPLARIQVALGILEQRADEKQRTAVEDVREEIQHMSELVNELLLFTKAGLKEKEIKLEPVKLADIAQRIVARETDGQVQVEIAGDVAVLAEPDLLTRALANLVRNSLRYAGNVSLSATATGAEVGIIVSDTGPGVPEESLQQIFDPFYRLEASRSRDSGGIGLGLAIVKTCIQACQGTVTAKNRQPTGLEVAIRLKRAMIATT